MLPACRLICARAPFESPNGTGGLTAWRFGLEKQLHRQLTSCAAVSLIYDILQYIIIIVDIVQYI